MPTDPPTLDRRGLYLVAPDDTVYGVAALRSDGSWVADVSDDGRQVLLHERDDTCASGCECPTDSAVEMQAYGYTILDLPTTSLRSVIDPVPLSVCGINPFSREVRFTNDGTGIWVAETWYDVDYQATRVRLSRVDIATAAWTELLADPVAVPDVIAPNNWPISFVELSDGRLVTRTGAGTWLRGPDGSPIRELGEPNAGCGLVQTWDRDHIVASCRLTPDTWPAWPPSIDPNECAASGLWLLALDGSGAEPLAVPVNEAGSPLCWISQTSAVRLGDMIAVNAGGDGCSDQVLLFGPSGDAAAWVPDPPDACTESLLGIRHNAWLISASPEDGATVVYEVTPEGSTRIELPSGWITVIGASRR